jgi:hypothetical protein
MDETAGQIEHEIEAERDRLGKNLEQLEMKIKSATDWRTQFNKYPLIIMGSAFGLGLILSMLTRRSSRRVAEPWYAR